MILRLKHIKTSIYQRFPTGKEPKWTIRFPPHKGPLLSAATKAYQGTSMATTRVSYSKSFRAAAISWYQHDSNIGNPSPAHALSSFYH